MDTSKEDSTSSPCGLGCSCNANKGPSVQVKLIVIIVVAGAVLATSLVKKSRLNASTKPATGYAVEAFGAQAASSVVKKDTSVSTVADMQVVSFKPLASISALNTVALDVDGVFILMVKNEAENTPFIVKEITETIKTIIAHGVHMGIFQLANDAPEYATLSVQVPPPGVIVIIKGRSMRGVQGADINKSKLLQAFMAAMQPASCCSSGGNRVCR